jgi:glutamyl-Q tRNA(Asp) synthetase
VPGANRPAVSYRGRFAPSPTGPLHFGSLVAAVASYAAARHAGGEWLIRIEDVDLPRSDRAAEATILAALSAYGFESDAPVVRQSERLPLFDEALAQLRRADAVYECACSRREVAQMQRGALGEPLYSRTCRNGISADRTARRQRAWRVDVDAATIAFDDLVQGPQLQHLATDVGDFVVRRADGLYAYQLAVVVDDAAQRVTHVVRGADLLASTARQIYLQQLLHVPTPSYLHVPIAVDAHGEKLSKQTRARAIPLDQPLPALHAAWRFLQQRDIVGVSTATAFWKHAAREWNVASLPRTSALPAPSAA